MIEPSSTDIDFSSMTKAELLAYADENNIEGVNSSMLKAEIYQIIVDTVVNK